MTDDGTLGDAVAGDGVRSATLPGFVAGTLIAFHIEVSNTEGADTTELQGKHDCRARLRAQLHAAPGAGPWTVRSHKHGLLLGEGKNMRLKNHPYLLGLILTFSVRLACGQAGPDILWKTNAHDTRISSIAISPNALLVASSDVDGFVRVWGAAGRALLKTFSLYMEEVYSVAFSPDGNYLGAGGGGGFDRYDSKVRVWSTGDWGLVTSLGDGARGVSAIAFSKDSAILAWTAASGNRLALWQISEGTYLVLLR